MFSKIKKEIKSIVKLKFNGLFLNTHLDQVFNDQLLSSIKVRSAEYTLDKIKNILKNEEAGAYLRFGDGDVFLMENRSDSFQQANDDLSREMESAFLISGEGILKCLAIHSDRFGIDDGMEMGIHKVPNDSAEKLLRNTYKYFIGNEILSPVALHHIAATNPDLCVNFLKLLKQKTTTFVGNHKVDREIINTLFKPSNIIDTPFENAYDNIDVITMNTVEAIIKSREFQVVVVAMGCAGRILMKRLIELDNGFNFFLFDFGSLLDGFDGNLSRTWLKEGNIDFNYIMSEMKKQS